MAPLPPVFVDHYELLGCNPDTPLPELRKAYLEKLRSYHPDKRKTSINGLGHEVTAALNEAWGVLSDNAKKEAYDRVWRKKMGLDAPPPPERRRPTRSEAGSSAAPTTPEKCRRNAASPAGGKDNFRFEERAEACRREGNELYKAAQVLQKQRADSEGGSMTATSQFQAAIAKYSLGIELAPLDHRMRSNRALCFCALKDWPRCREDARKATQLKPDFMKGWFLLAKALWKEGSPAAASRELEVALNLLPGNTDLLALQEEIAEELRGGLPPRAEKPHFRGAIPSRNVSPCGPPMPPSWFPPPLSRPCSSPPGPRRSKSPGPWAGDCGRRSATPPCEPRVPCKPPVPPGQPPVGQEANVGVGRPAGMDGPRMSGLPHPIHRESPCARRNDRLPSLSGMAARSAAAYAGRCRSHSSYN
eukprot:TRINITY_DN57081_c0_g1_i1.p1 TRINITY_DN57081_c0_g1~~TRINITY_DN57081_c0_g1_i1.p1  ORF type:complete len:417 (+),score=54.96 TRINITY_DN57081_c0_g1_i1:122-1372(+)